MTLPWYEITFYGIYVLVLALTLLAIRRSYRTTMQTDPHLYRSMRRAEEQRDRETKSFSDP